jgi:hypothetical protein
MRSVLHDLISLDSRFDIIQSLVKLFVLNIDVLDIPFSLEEIQAMHTIQS